MVVYKGKSYDKQYQELCNRIYEEGELDTNPRPKYEDGEPAHVRSVFHHTFKFTPEDVPLLFSKKVFTRQAIEEILWIFRDRSNVVQDLKDKNVHIWDSWSKSHREHNLVYVRPIEYKGLHNGQEIRNYHHKELVQNVLETRDSKTSGKFNVISKDWRTQRYTIQFVDTGYIAEVSQSQVSVGDVKDWYKRSVNELGYYGDHKKDSIKKGLGKYYKRWVNTWENMIRRCSNSYDNQWKEYEDVYVSSEFQCCETFLDWVIDNAPMEKEKLGVLQIDKDYYNSKVYSPDTCVLLTPYENSCLNSLKWYVYKGELSISEIEFARKVSKLTNGIMGLTPKGKVSTTLKTFIKESIEQGDLIILRSNEFVEGKLPRFNIEWNETIQRAYGYQLAQEVGHTGRNQVDNLIHNLKTNPESRRHVVHLWNVEDIDDMALTPCVFLTQWCVVGNALHLEVIVRSNDIALGNPFNCIQYWVLHKLIAKEVGIKAGDVMFTMVMPHIYDRHLDTINEQMRRLSDLNSIDPVDDKEITVEIDDVGFYDFTMDNIRIKGYDNFGGEPLKKYSFEVGI